MLALYVYMLLMIIVAVGCDFFQLLGKKYVGEWSSLIATGSTFKYNYIVYIIGLWLFFSVMYLLYKHVVKKKFEVTTFNSHQKIEATIVVIVGGILMLAALFVKSLVIDGNNNFTPQFFRYITVFGWPLLTTIIMLVRVNTDM